MNTPPRIVQEITNGNLVIAPTDTIYGILADATNPTAIEKVKTAKHRAAAKPLILLMSDLAMLHTYTKNLSPLEQQIITQYFPGPLTVLLPRNSNVSDQITGGNPLVGIRIPDHPSLLEIIHHLNRPLISTSANLAGQPPITNPSQLSPELLQHISYVENAGTINSPRPPSSKSKTIKSKSSGPAPAPSSL